MSSHAPTQYMKHILDLNASLNVFSIAKPCRQESERLPFVGDLEPVTALQQGTLTASLDLNIVDPFAPWAVFQQQHRQQLRQHQMPSKLATIANSWQHAMCYVLQSTSLEAQCSLPRSESSKECMLRSDELGEMAIASFAASSLLTWSIWSLLQT